MIESTLSVKPDPFFRRLSLAAAVATYILIVVGALVRTTGSGLGCPDWPLCHGQLVPVSGGDWTTAIEFSHRLVSAAVSALIVAVAYFAWKNYRAQKWIYRSALLAIALLIVQIVLGGITVILELPPVIVAAHLGNSLLILALLIVIALDATRPWDAIARVARDNLPRLALWSTVGAYIVIISGTFVLGTFAHWRCTTWPLCDQVFPSEPLPIVAVTHRYITAAIGVLILYTFWQTYRTRRAVPRVLQWATYSAFLFILQILVGALNVFTKFDVIAGMLHLATAAAVWSAMVVFTLLVYRTTE
ncbi:MAG: heme A synthase [Chloroflexi bacterium]|nr:heme A synthase [Chloroflexota bacterium]